MRIKMNKVVKNRMLNVEVSLKISAVRKETWWHVCIGFKLRAKGQVFYVRPW